MRGMWWYYSFPVNGGKGGVYTIFIISFMPERQGCSYKLYINLLSTMHCSFFKAIFYYNRFLFPFLSNSL